MSEATEEEVTLFEDLTKEDKLANSVMSVFDRGYAEGYKKGHTVGVEWGSSGFSKWWYLPSITCAFFAGCIAGLLIILV